MWVNLQGAKTWLGLIVSLLIIIMRSMTSVTQEVKTFRVLSVHLCTVRINHGLEKSARTHHTIKYNNYLTVRKIQKNTSTVIHFVFAEKGCDSKYSVTLHNVSQIFAMQPRKHSILFCCCFHATTIVIAWKQQQNKMLCFLGCIANICDTWVSNIVFNGQHCSLLLIKIHVL